MFDLLTVEQIVADFVPAVRQHLSLEIDEAWTSRMSRWIGGVTFNLLNLSETTSELNDALLGYFRQLVGVDSPEVIGNVCYNLPGMYFIFNKGELDFVSILSKYAASKDSAIRLQVARWFHEIVGISGMGK